MEIASPSATGTSQAALSEVFLRGQARLALGRLARTDPEFGALPDTERLVQRTATVLAANTASGRFQAARQYQPALLADDAALLSYAEQVLVELVRESDRIEALHRGDTVAWQLVIYRLERLAYRVIGPHGREEWAAWEARELAAYTCADLWRWLQDHAYPFDVPFDRWSACALNNRLRDSARKRAWEARFRLNSFDQTLLDEPGSGLRSEQLVDRSLDARLEQTANREALLQVLERLEGRHRLILRLWYLEQWPSDEIAAQMGTSIGNVYQLRFRAIEKLRQIVVQDERFGLSDTLTLIKGEAHRARPAIQMRPEPGESGA